MDNQIVAAKFTSVAQGAGLRAELQEVEAINGRNCNRAIVEIHDGPANLRRVVIENNPLPRVYEFLVQHELGGEWVKILKVEAEEHQVGDLIYFVVAGLSA